MKYSKLLSTLIILTSFTVCSMNVFGQGIGNSLVFQGLTNQNEQSGVKARAMGNAYTGISGDINTIFYNPAGLAGVGGFQISASIRNGNYKQFETQQFIPVGGKYGIMELIWAGVYTPQLEDDGVRSDFIKYDLENDFTKVDSAVEYYDEKYADWVDEKSTSGLNNIIAAIPFNLFDKKFVASASYTSTAIYDFDRNEHVLGVDYGWSRVIADSNWYVYNRQRSGERATYMAALGSEINEHFDVGLSLEYMTGESDDDISKEIIGHMQIQQEQNQGRLLPSNTYFFWHDSVTNGLSGTSQLSSFKVGLGAIYKSDKITFGLRINLPYTLSQTYNYHEYQVTKFPRDSTASPVRKQGNAVSGTNKFKAPFSFDLGFTLMPTDFVKLSVDYKIKPFSNADYELTTVDTLFSKWALPNLNSFHAGLEIVPIKYVSLLAGYSIGKNALRPEDHYKGERTGTNMETISAGLSIRVPYVQLDVAYEWSSIKYIDYYSYHNDYISMDNDRLLAGITVIF